LLIWEFSEIGYNISRYCRIPAYESINFLDLIKIRVEGNTVYMLHAVRLVVGLLLITRRC